MIEAKFYDFKTNKPVVSVTMATLAEGLEAMHPDAAVFWDRDMAHIELHSTVRLEITANESWPALWGYGNVCWGSRNGSDPMHCRFVLDPVCGGRWLLVGSEEWTNYAQCVKLLRDISGFSNYL